MGGFYRAAECLPYEGWDFDTALLDVENDCTAGGKFGLRGRRRLLALFWLSRLRLRILALLPGLPVASLPAVAGVNARATLGFAGFASTLVHFCCF